MQGGDAPAIRARNDDPNRTAPPAHLRSVGPGALVLVAVSRAPLRGSDEFLRGAGSYSDS